MTEHATKQILEAVERLLDRDLSLDDLDVIDAVVTALAIDHGAIATWAFGDRPALRWHTFARYDAMSLVD